MTVADQARAFAAMMLCGACAGMADDLLSLLRKGAWLAAAADMLLGVVCAAGIIGAGLLLGCDPFRAYALLGICAGWTIYALSLGTIVRILKGKFIKLSNKVTKSEKKGKNMQENGK